MTLTHPGIRKTAVEWVEALKQLRRGGAVRALRALDSDFCSSAYLLEHRGIADDLAEDVHGAGRPDLRTSAHGGGAEEDAEGGAGRPVAEIAQLHGLERPLRLGLHGDGEVDLVAPRLARHSERERVPHEARRLRLV